MSPAPLEYDDLAGRVGQTFAIATDEGLIEARLVEVRALTPLPGLGRAHPFSFDLETAATLDQRTWTIAHPDLGEHDVFLVPVGRSDGALRLEAVFN